MSNLEDQLKKLIEQHEADSQEIQALYKRNSELLAWSAQVVRIFVPENEETKPNLEIMGRAVQNAIEAINDAAAVKERAFQYAMALFDLSLDKTIPPPPLEEPKDLSESEEERMFLALAESWKKGKKPHSISAGEELVQMRKVMAGVILFMGGISKLGK